jgi:MFS superfamily sulfate permease-like transporter
VLASVVVVAVVHLIEFRHGWNYLRVSVRCGAALSMRRMAGVSLSLSLSLSLSRRDFATFVVVVVVALFVGIPEGIFAGVGLSWFLVLALAYSNPVPVRVLDRQRRGSHDASATLVDRCSTAEGRPGPMQRESFLAVLELKLSLVFANSEKIKVRVRSHGVPTCV